MNIYKICTSRIRGRNGWSGGALGLKTHVMGSNPREGAVLASWRGREEGGPERATRQRNE